MFILCVALRKLEAKRKNVEGEIEQLGSVKNYTNIQRRAPRSRRDPFSNSSTCNFEINSHYLNTYEGLNPFLTSTGVHHLHKSISEATISIYFHGNHKLLVNHTLGLQELEAGLPASVFKSLGKTYKPIKSVISPPGSTEVELIEKYKVRKCRRNVFIKLNITLYKQEYSLLLLRRP